MRNKTLITLALLLTLSSTLANTTHAEFETFRHKRTNKIIWANVPSEPVVSAASVDLGSVDLDSDDKDQNADDTKPVDFAATKAKEFVDRHSRMLGVKNNELRYWNTKKDNLGISHTVFGQEYQYNTSVKNKSKAKTIPIFGGQFDVHSRLDGSVKNVGGYTAEVRRLSPRVRINKRFAKALAVQMWRESFKTQRMPKIGRVEKLVLVPELLRSDNQNADEAYLVWKVELFSKQEIPGQSWAVFVDAQTGVERGPRMPLEQGLDRLITDCSYDPGSNFCWAGRDNPSDPWEYRYGRSEGMEPSGPNPRYIPTMSEDTDDSYDTIGFIHSLVQDVYGIDGANNQGGIGEGSTYPVTRTRVRTYSEYVSGQTCPGAAFLKTGTIILCGGMSTSDILGHEYGHALMFYAHRDANSNPQGLAYQNEVGALEESHSDVFGEFVEYRRIGACDWKFGTNSSIVNARDFSDPQSANDPNGYGKPDRLYSPQMFCQYGTGQNIYTNMKVANKAYYLSVNGGFFNGCTIQGIGIEAAFKIWTRAALNYYSFGETFNGAYYKLISSCISEYGEMAPQCNSVKRALQAVELDQGGACSGIPASVPSCIDEIGW